MRIALTERFQRAIRGLSPDQRARVFEIILVLPTAMGQPHAHAGIGLRKIHTSGIWEARVGLGLRVVFGFREETLVLDLVGNHEDIRRYLKSL